MRRRPLTHSFRGASLIELIVASFIVGLMMLEIWKLVAAGSTFYRRARSQSEIQRNSLLALRWMARELSEGSSIAFRGYPTENTLGEATGTVHGGIAFGSPQLTGEPRVTYNSEGRMLWASVICYFIDPNDFTLYRQQVPLPAPFRTSPPIIDNDEHHPDVMARRPRPRVVARHIRKIESQQGPKDIIIKLSTRDTELGFGINVQTRLEMKN